MDTKSNRKRLYWVVLIICIFMLAISSLAFVDFFGKRVEYLRKDAFVKSRVFCRAMDNYVNYLQVILQNKKEDEKKFKNNININSEEKKANNKITNYNYALEHIKNRGELKFYFKDKELNKVFTNIDVSGNFDIHKYIKVNGITSRFFPCREYVGFYDMGYCNNEWFLKNNMEGYIVFIKTPKMQYQLQKDYIYYDSVKQRLIKEIYLGIGLFLFGVVGVIYSIKKGKLNIIQKLKLKYRKIPIDIRFVILLIYSSIILKFQVEEIFFILPITVFNFIIVTYVSIYIFYITISVSNMIEIVKEKENVKEQIQNSIFYKFIEDFKSCLMFKSMFLKFILLLIFISLFVYNWESMFSDISHKFIFKISIIYFLILIFIVIPYIINKLALITKLIKATDEIVAGNLDYAIDEVGNGEISRLIYNINNMKNGVRKSMDNQMKSERLKSELITNVSHDLKTPLTSIINYANLLKDGQLSKEEQCDYIRILNKKSQRLKVLIDDLFEASKMASGSVELNIEKVDVSEILRQSLGEFDEKIKESSLDFKTNIPRENIYSRLDGKRTWRVFENLIGNILKYSMKNTRVYIDVIKEKEKVKIIMKNIASYEMNFSPDEIYERFKRGDSSRSTEGSGLGLAIAKSIVELQNGNMNIGIDGDLFKVTIEFDLD